MSLDDYSREVRSLDPVSRIGGFDWDRPGTFVAFLECGHTEIVDGRPSELTRVVCGRCIDRDLMLLNLANGGG